MNIVCDIISSHAPESYDEGKEIEAGSERGRLLFYLIIFQNNTLNQT